MKVAFVVTNYNNSRYTKALLESLSKSRNFNNFFVVIVDNDSVEEDKIKLRLLKNLYVNVCILENNTNVGYFRGLNVGLEYLRNSHFDADVVIVGNNDLVFPLNFCDELVIAVSHHSDKPVIAPDLVTLDGVHQNPHVSSGISRFRVFVWVLYYSNYCLGVLIKFLASKLKFLSARGDEQAYRKAGFISEGYGACYILNRLFFKEFGLFDAPTFLMGEEFFLKKQLESKGYKTYYEPYIRVEHHDHATTGKIPSRKMWEIAKESHAIYKGYLKKNLK